jgi:hypothetical protein
VGLRRENLSDEPPSGARRRFGAAVGFLGEKCRR